MAFLGRFFLEQTIIGTLDLLYRATQCMPKSSAVTLDFLERSVAARFALTINWFMRSTSLIL